MLYMAIGEWVTANVLFSVAFIVALLGIVGIAVYVLRGDRMNRVGLDDGAETTAADHEAH